MTFKELDYDSGAFRGHANRYERRPVRQWLTQPDELRTEASYHRMVASDLEEAAQEVENRKRKAEQNEVLLDAEYGPKRK
jgi:hypothetical protein